MFENDVLHDRHMVLGAVGVVVGAVVAHGLPTMWFVLAGAVAVLGLALRRPVAFVIGLAVVASVLAAHSWSGLRPPPARVIRDQWVTLLSDPEPYPGGSIGADVLMGRAHVSAFARAVAGQTMSKHLAGEHLKVSGVLRPLQGVQRARQAPKHIAARLSINSVDGSRTANLIGSVANDYRRIVATGAHALPDQLEPLFGGMVLGDDRGQSAELQDAFKAAGLTHLLVVSGENVAFALLVAAPLIRRGGLRWRFVATLAVLGGFGVLTRWEPSVVRAEAMAAVAAAGALVGRPVPALRLLSLAVIACVLVDPLLVHSVGFQLSVAACSGLVLLTPRLTRRGVPLLLAASIAAQAGAAIVLVPTFGSVPLVSLPANVLAVPLAGPLMMWGLVVCPVAGILSPLAWLIHVPDHLILWWEAGVARWAAGVPLAPLDARTAALFAFGLSGAVIIAWLAPRSQQFAVGLGIALTAVVIASTLRPPVATDGAQIDPDVRLWVVEGHSVLLMAGRVSPNLLETLRLRRINRLDVLVLSKPGRSAADAAWSVMQAMHPRVVLAPEHHQLAGARTARRGASVGIGPLDVRVTAAGPPLEVSVTRRGSAAVYRHGRDPPPR